MGGGGAVCAGSLRRVGLYKAEEGGKIAPGIGKRRLTMGPKKTNKKKKTTSREKDSASRDPRVKASASPEERRNNNNSAAEIISK